MQNEEEIIDDSMSQSEERLKDERLHKQLKIFWIILIILQGLNLLPGVNGKPPTTANIIIGLIPIFFYYTIVIKKMPRFITWGLLYLVITALMSVGLVFYSISALIGSGAYNIAALVLFGFLFIVLGFQIWGIILHGKFRVE